MHKVDVFLSFRRKIFCVKAEEKREESERRRKSISQQYETRIAHKY